MHDRREKAYKNELGTLKVRVTPETQEKPGV
jgi:hypothetical protein